MGVVQDKGGRWGLPQLIATPPPPQVGPFPAVSGVRIPLFRNKRSLKWPLEGTHPPLVPLTDLPLPERPPNGEASAVRVSNAQG